MKDILKLLHSFQIGHHESDLVLKVKLLSILFASIAYNLSIYNFEKAESFFKHLINPEKVDIYKQIPNSPLEVNYGFRLLVEIKAIIKFYLKSYSKNKELYDLIKKEHVYALISYIEMNKLDKTKENFDKFFNLRLNRVNIKLNVMIEMALAENLNLYNYKNESNFKLNIEEYLAFGQYLTIISTLVRDSKRELGLKSMNSFHYFSQFFDAKDYMNYAQKERKELYDKFKNNSLLISSLKKSEEGLRKHFNFEDKSINF